jgi:hypothetical protein
MFADLAERVWKLVSKNGHPKYKRTVIELAWKRSDATRELELKAHLNSQTYSCAGTPSDNRNSKNVQAQLRDKDSQVLYVFPELAHGQQAHCAPVPKELEMPKTATEQIQKK